MKYKFKDGGIVKLQNAGTTIPDPQEAILRVGAKKKAIEEAQKKAKEQVASEKPKYTFVNPYDYTRGGREATEDAAKQDKYTIQNLGGSNEEAQEAYNNTGKNSRKQLAATTTQGLLMAPMLGEFGTYGLLGGGLRIGAGMAGSKAGEYVLGKGGDGADKQLNTKFLGTTGRIVGGLAMYPFGSSIGYKGALNLAERFPRFARFGATNRFTSDVVGNALNKSIGKTTFYNIPVYHATDYIGNGNDLLPYGPADSGLHVGTDKSPAIDIFKTRTSKPGTIYEGVYTYTNHTKPYQLDVDPGHTNVFHFGTDSQIERLKANSPIGGVNKDDYVGVGKTIREQEQNIGRQILIDDGISAIEYPNRVEGTPGNKSIALMNPNDYIFSKNRLPSTVIIDPQTAATTYNGLRSTLDDISQVPEPFGIGYSGYTPTKSSRAISQFVKDVQEAVQMANARGSIEEPKTTLFNIGDLKFIGSGAEHSVYEHPTNPNKVLKKAHDVQGYDRDGAINVGKQYIKLHDPLYNMRLNIEGVGKTDYGAGYPIFSQGKLQTLPKFVESLEKAQALRDAIDTFASRIGADPVYRGNMKVPINNIFLENSDLIQLGGKDFKPSNIGFTKDGILMGYDLHKQGGTINRFKNRLK